MRVIVTRNYEEMSRVAAEQIVKLMNTNPRAVLGLATGSTPEGMYKKIVEAYERGEVDFSKATTFNLDEYRGLNPEHPQSYRYFMNNNLFNHINVLKENTFVPNGMAENIEEECKEYDERIKKYGGIDLQVLGIGNNGHIGFNEPSDFLYMGTHLTSLAEDTIKANSRFFNNVSEVPTQAVTMGLGGIMRARRILLLASGEKKADIIAKLVEGKISTKIPASILQVHQDVLVIVDELAASGLKNIHNDIVEIIR